MEWWQDPAILVQAASLLAIIAGFIGGLLFLWRWTRAHDRMHIALEGLPRKVDDLNVNVETMMSIELDRTPNLWDKVKTYSTPKSNPYDPARKNLLLDRMRSGSINLGEAQELEGILNEDLARARAEGAGAVIAIVAVLGALGALIYFLTRK